MDGEEMNPVVVDFPLRGEWNAYNTPGHVVPSHGTDLFAQTYAFDFVRRDWSVENSIRFSKRGRMKFMLFGAPLRECFGWSQPYFSPFDGEVIEVEDGTEERDPVHLLKDLSVGLRNVLGIGRLIKAAGPNSSLKHLLGNYIILKNNSGVYALFAHSRNGSICVTKGERVQVGTQLAEVGHSGNSTGPHLHFQLMDGPSVFTAKGLPCCFRQYELFENERWTLVSKGIPKREDRIRSADA
ncbi:MAG: M23 family metallopeptidase [Bacteroidota bacterium]